MDENRPSFKNNANLYQWKSEQILIEIIKKKKSISISGNNNYFLQENIISSIAANFVMIFFRQ